QRSGFPDAYAQHEAMSRAWASALTGHSPGAVTCVVHESVAGDATALLERVERDLGDVPARIVPASDDDAPVVVELDAGSLTGSRGDGAPRLAWALAQWAVAAGATTGVLQVEVGEARWTVEDAAWDDVDVAGAVQPGLVRVTLRG